MSFTYIGFNALKKGSLTAGERLLFPFKDAIKGKINCYDLLYSRHLETAVYIRKELRYLFILFWFFYQYCK